MIEQTDKLRFKEICNVSRETFDKLQEYSDFLKETNNKFNLVGKSTLQSVWIRHFADSIKLKPLIELVLNDTEEKIKICDVGSGAGFPGVVLAILANANKWNVTVTLIESNFKKANFLQELSRILGLNILIFNKRAEQVITSERRARSDGDGAQPRVVLLQRRSPSVVDSSSDGVPGDWAAAPSTLWLPFSETRRAMPSEQSPVQTRCWCRALPGVAQTYTVLPATQN